MPESTEAFLTFVETHRLKVFIFLTLLFMVGFAISPLKSRRQYNLMCSNQSDLNFAVKANGTIPEFCQVTYQVQKTRERENTAHVNPARHVVEELLQMITFTPEVCSDRSFDTDGERLAVIIVDTARSHFKDRQLIRRTWGSVQKYKGWRVRTVFLMGQSDHCLEIDFQERSLNGFVFNETVLRKEKELSMEEKALIKESQLHGDIVIGAFADTYRNLTYKHLMGYKFVQEICPQAEFIIKTDDDMFVDVFGILNARGEELKKNSSDDAKIYDIYCHKYHDNPSRTRNSKWFSTREEWPEDTYPVYCLGNDYGISMEWLKKIYSVRGLGGFFWVDDVFIMGKLRVIAEKNYSLTANMLNMWGAGKTTDERGNPDFIQNNCKREDADVHIGWFLFLSRNNDNFVKDMECLWGRALRIANVTAVFVSARL